MHDVVRRRLDEIEASRAQMKADGRPLDGAVGLPAYYTVDKREVPDRHWAVVADILKQLGLEQHGDSRSLTIP